MTEPAKSMASPGDRQPQPGVERNFLSQGLKWLSHNWPAIVILGTFLIGIGGIVLTAVINEFL